MARPEVALWLLLAGAIGISLSLLWDFSWESTVGIDKFWAGPHVAAYFAVGLATLPAITLIVRATRELAGISLGRWHGPLGAWITIWGGAAFATALLFDHWWQSSYGLAAGIWHPPQILKAVSFFAVATGAWLVCAAARNNSDQRTARTAEVQFAIGGAAVLALISVVSLILVYANLQHSAAFYELACATYPIVLLALAAGAGHRWAATSAALGYLVIIGVTIWLLPLIPAKPQVAPIYNGRDHLMPPPFPLLLLLPALALDALRGHALWHRYSVRPWLQAAVAGVVFFAVFLGVQWNFSEFLLSDLADNRFFAGGGRHWPFFLKIDHFSRQLFWEENLNLRTTLAALGLSVGAARVGIALGNWMKRL